MDDLISRNQTYNLLAERMWDTALYNACEDAGTIVFDIVHNRLEKWLNELPSTQKTGKWIQAEDIPTEYAVCTNCKGHGEFYMDYCWHCGSKNRGEKE